jgi:serine/threonine protein kinase
LEALGYLHQK